MSKLIEADKALLAVDERILELYKIGIFRKKADSIDVLGVKKWINDIPTIHAIPIEKVKKAREKIESYVYEDKYDCINDDMTGWICASEVVAILDKLLAESEE